MTILAPGEIGQSIINVLIQYGILDGMIRDFMAYVPGVIFSNGARPLKYFLSGEREEFSAFVG